MKLKPGQLCTINGVLYRAMKKEMFMSCFGCAFNNAFSCPNIKFTNDVKNEPYINCQQNDFILVKI